MADMQVNNATQVAATNTTGPVTAGNKSIQMLFAELQMQIAQDRKADAVGIIDQIKNSQAKSKRYAELIKNLRGAYTGTEDKSGKNKDRMNAVKKYKDEFVALGGSANYFSGDKLSPTQLDKMVNDMQTLQDTVGSDIQQKMIYVQDYIGQYNSYMQGANSAINTANQTLTAIARGS